MHILRNRWRLAVTAGAAALPLALLGAGLSSTASATPKPALPAIKHVWVIELENEGFGQSFGNPKIDPYLAVTLPKMGAELKNYFAIGHDSLDNYIAQVTGQAPDTATQNDCGVWTKFTPTNKIEKPFNQLVGNGCVYPKSIPTLGNQLSDAHLSWKAYLQDMGNDPARDHTTNLCMDGHDAPCANGDPGGLTEINSFLQIWVPQILNSPAYKQGGLIFITFDEGSNGAACCGETLGKSPSHPNVAQPGMPGPGGGRVGAALLSPFIKPGTVSNVDYNHYSMLRTIEDFFGVSHLGDAAMPQVKPFGSDVFTKS